MWICEQLGLIPLMQIKEDYNVDLVQQFFATLVFGNKPEIDFQWMSGGRKHKSNFVKFAQLLEYPFEDANTPSGERVHTIGQEYSKSRLAPLYGISDFVPGKTNGLRQLYNILMRLFRENIAPSSGNADDIRSGLVNLMYYAHKVYINKSDCHPRVMKKLDVMYFIYQEMYLGIQDKQKAPSMLLTS